MKISPYLLLISSLCSYAAEGPLFVGAQESFQLKDKANRTPQFQLFKSSMTQKALAMAINKFFQFPTKPSQNHLDLRFEKISFQNLKGPKASISLKVNSKDFELEPRFLKEDLIQGKTILVRARSETHDIGLFQVSTKGSFQMRYDSKSMQLFIQEAKGEFSFENPLGEEEIEKLQFSATGIRE